MDVARIFSPAAALIPRTWSVKETANETADVIAFAFCNPWPAYLNFREGQAQGELNLINGLQDALIAIPNLVPMMWNIGNLFFGGPQMGYIPSPDWSKP